MDENDPFQRDDCPIKRLGVSEEGNSYWFLNDKAEVISLTEEELAGDGLERLFTTKESRKWARRHWPSKHYH